MRINTKQEVIFPAINTNRFKNKKQRVSFEYKKTIEILTVARLHWIKGLEYIIEALGKLEAVNFKYKIIGSGIEYERLTLVINQLNLKDKVKLSTNLFLVRFKIKYLKFFSTVLCVIIAIEAFPFFLFGVCIKFLIEILFLANILVIEDKTPG